MRKKRAKKAEGKSTMMRRSEYCAPAGSKGEGCMPIWVAAKPNEEEDVSSNDEVWKCGLINYFPTVFWRKKRGA